MAERNESKLPRWAQERLNALRGELQWAQRELDTTREAHTVLYGRQWFTLPHPNRQESDPDGLTFFVLARNQAVPVCSLYDGDTLLVGRKRKDA